MKTLQKGEDIKRVKDEEVDTFLRKGYKLVPKSVWKDATRPKKNQDPGPKES